ncbi:MAG TPA: NB-ARC domain-containing protein, partial [Ktedonobacteraceae bacterium]|nr:NB-ARC domain-containing protein [Ktedonobacteraceae bacterium]
IAESLGDGGALLGRYDLLMEVKERLFAGENVALTDLDGLPGIGKTALVAALATDQEVREHFCDGILWAKLGPRPNMMSHLVRWGKLLGVTPSQVKDINNRQAWGYALQDAIDTRQMLLIIDDAWSVEDALSLQVGGIACAHVLTTRQSQVALAFDQTGSMIIPELEGMERIALLSRFVPQLVEQDSQGAFALVQSVGGLPLALTLMGKYLASPSLPVQPQPLQIALALLHDIYESLRVNMPRALEESSDNLGETIPLNLRAVIALCDQLLSPQAHAALYALAIFLPKPESFSQEAGLAVTQQPIEILGELCDAGLLETCGPGRYILHGAVADYARSQDQDEALTVQQQQPRSRADNIQVRDRHWSGNHRSWLQSLRNVRVGPIKQFGPFKRFSWRAWGILSTILLATLLIIVSLLTFNSLSLHRSIQITHSPTTQSSISYEAEAPGNLLSGARLMNCPECSGGSRVGYIEWYFAVQQYLGRKCRLLQSHYLLC